MLKKGLIGLVACVSLLGVSAAAAEKIDFDQGVDVGKIVESVKAEVAAQKDRAASWTIMVFVNAKNNLERYGLLDVNEMEQVGSSDKVKIAVELGRISGYDSSDGDWKGQRRYIVQKDSDPGRITSPVLQDIPKADMGDWNHLVDFVRWAQAAAPAQRYMLIVWNHGSGWNRQEARDMTTMGISYDDETGNHMTTLDLGSAMASIGKVDIYAADACLMQMAEVDYQIKDYADFIVASEETEPADGYTYDKLLSPLSANPAMPPIELAKTAAQAYTDHYAGKGATQSSVRAAALVPLLAALNGWTEAVMTANETQVVKTALNATQDFYYSDNKDLYDFVKRVDAATKNDAVKSRGLELEKLILEVVVTHNAVSGASYAGASGLAIYLPNSSFNGNYDKLAWAKDGGWAKFARWASGLR
ncbi:MAG: hypothetical protein HY922_02255 [Elusimicrobia bacterium]|nr:hypothetical protein [Elusimicrobiota bacterium]